MKAKPKMPADWYEAYLASLKIGRAGLPEIVDVTQYRDIIGVGIQKAIEGAKSADVMAQAHKEFQELLDRPRRSRSAGFERNAWLLRPRAGRRGQAFHPQGKVG